ncbi:MAG: hypothetical protein LKE39_02225 [Sphaerochaeta sp.]|jgi:hypothetical protein|nr:hypothetical protein [Sphaerochaeta sp.]MCH3919303.1 hypothetical protein [Sphaerochaeta sp.]
MKPSELFTPEEITFLSRIPRLFLLDFEGDEELDDDDLDEIFDAVMETEQSASDTAIQERILDAIQKA